MVCVFLMSTSKLTTIVPDIVHGGVIAQISHTYLYATIFEFIYNETILSFGGNDHTNMTAPLPVCSAKLSMFGPG